MSLQHLADTKTEVGPNHASKDVMTGMPDVMSMFNTEACQKFIKDFGWVIMALILIVFLIMLWFRKSGKEGRSTTVSANRVFKTI